MPCSCEGYEPSRRDIEAHKAWCVKRELDGVQLTPSDWVVKSNAFYAGDKDKLVAEVCRRLQEVDVTKYSLELQMWWRDHQEADRRRQEKERKAAEDAALRASALAKLTPEEIRVLGIRQ